MTEFKKSDKVTLTYQGYKVCGEIAEISGNNFQNVEGAYYKQCRIEIEFKSDNGKKSLESLYATTLQLTLASVSYNAYFVITTFIRISEKEFYIKQAFSGADIAECKKQALEYNYFGDFEDAEILDGVIDDYELTYSIHSYQAITKAEYDIIAKYI